MNEMTGSEREVVFAEPAATAHYGRLYLWVMQAQISAMAKVVYSALAYLANWETGVGSPAQTKIAEMCACTDRTVRTALRELQEIGAVKVERRGLNRSNTYVIAVSEPFRSGQEDIFRSGQEESFRSHIGPDLSTSEEEQEQEPRTTSSSLSFLRKDEPRGPFDLEKCSSEASTTEDVETRCPHGSASTWDCNYCAAERSRQEPLSLELTPWIDQNPSQATDPPQKASATGLLAKPQDAFSHEVRFACSELARILNDELGFKPAAKVTNAWLQDMDRLMRLDGRGSQDVEWMLDWLAHDKGQAAAFWRPNIRSPKKLRAHWDQMAARRDEKTPHEAHMDMLREMHAKALREGR